MNTDYDIIIIGGGAVGLCFAASAARQSLKVLVIEKSPKEMLTNPAYDGREIAITMQTQHILDDLGIWSLIPQNEISEIKQAIVLYENEHKSLKFSAQDVKKSHLGYLVSHQWIKKTSFENLSNFSNVHYIFEKEITSLQQTDQSVHLTLNDHTALSGRLLMIADGRFSSTRQMAGIGVSTQDFGKKCYVFKMKIEHHHNQTAYECFYAQGTLAILPLRNHYCSVVLTISKHDEPLWLNLSSEDFSQKIAEVLLHRYGQMQLVSDHYAYQLVTVYANNFVKNRVILLGDAAIGMHPMTAHGFNFGVLGQYELAKIIKLCCQTNQFTQVKHVLRRYEIKHRLRTKLLYMATNFIATVFAHHHTPYQLGCGLLISLSNHLPFAKHLLMQKLLDVRSG